jgi:hypothetical protein
VEFGAHQVVLTRSMDSVERLPEGLRDSNALMLTVPQVDARCIFKLTLCSLWPRLLAIQLLPNLVGATGCRSQLWVRSKCCTSKGTGLLPGWET